MMSFFSGTQGASAQVAAVPAASQSSAAPALSLANNFTYDTYNGTITPIIFNSTINGSHGTLTLDAITGAVYTADGLDVNLTGTYDGGYGQQLANVSFLLEGDYLGEDLNMMMFNGFAQIGAPITPEPRSIALLGTGMLCLAGLMRRRLVTRPVQARNNRSL